MRCKACNAVIMGSLTYTVKLETGEFMEVEETLCRACRKSLSVSENETAETPWEYDPHYITVGEGCYRTKPPEVE